MKWSWRIGTIAGIGIYIHSTFLILLAWIALVHYLRGNDLIDFLHGIILLVTVFGTVVLHELGHALAARRYGIPTRDITLLPIGGVARLERMPEDPKQELVVAIAGPAVNVALGLLCVVAIGLIAGFSDVGKQLEQAAHQMEFFANNPDTLRDLNNWPLMGILFFARWLIINIVLVVFNLLPAFPMDGGRVLRAFLAMQMDYMRATQVAAGVGQMMALLFGLLGLFGNPILLFIALFVWMGASSEASMVQMRVALGGIPARHAMVTEFRAVSPDATIADVADHILAGFQQDFPVIDEAGNVVGMLTRADVLRTLAQQAPQTRVADVMRTDFCKAAPNEMLQDVFERLQQAHCRSMPVVEGSQIVGVIDMENIGEFIAIRSALQQHGGRAGETPII